MNTVITPRHNTRRARPEPLHRSWEDAASCYNRPQTWWDDDATPEQAVKARKQCLKCPVLVECLQAAQSVESGDLGRSQMKAGLTGKQRDWLHRYTRRGDAYDVEEARLLALESSVTGRLVRDIARRENVEGLTLRLAERFLSDLPGTKSTVVQQPQPKAAKMKPGERAAALIEDILTWRSDGVSLEEIGKRVGVARRTVCSVIEQYLEAESKGASVPVVRSRIADQIEAITEYRRRGLEWKQIDDLMKVAHGTTYRRVSRWRKRVEDAGGTVPVGLGRDYRLLPEEQVLDIRERAARGEPDIEQGLRTGMSPSNIASIANGTSYKRYGGPLRPKKSGKPSVTSRVQWAGGQAGFVQDDDERQAV